MSSLVATFLGAFQGTVSVLLTIVSGYVAAKLRLIDSHTVHQLSKLCSNIFLPCLILTQMGPGITVEQLRLLWIIPVWGLTSSIFSHMIGFFGKSALGLPSWTILAAGRANSSALPLLLLQSLESVGILDILKSGDETSEQTLTRARGFVLLNTIVQEVLTFSIGKQILLYDYQDSKQTSASSSTPRRATRRLSGSQNESVGLLDDQGDSLNEDQQDYISTAHRLADRTRSRVPRPVRRFGQCMVYATSWVNPVIFGALLAILFGLTPKLHQAFLSEHGRFFPSITQPLLNLGKLFIVLQMFVVGAELELVHTAKPGVIATSFSLLIRFIVMPAVGLAFVYFTARRGIYPDDPLLWFTLIMIPCGPSAMLLMSIAENAGVDQGPIAGYLAICYAFAPVVAICCALALKVIDIVKVV